MANWYDNKNNIAEQVSNEAKELLKEYIDGLNAIDEKQDKRLDSLSKKIKECDERITHLDLRENRDKVKNQDLFHQFNTKLYYLESKVNILYILIAVTVFGVIGLGFLK